MTTAPTANTAAVQLFSTLDGVRVDTLPELSPAAWEALDLYRRGFNVFPQPFAKKGGYPWSALIYCRLAADDLPGLFHYRCNLAVMTGRTSGDLFVIDCETANEFERQRAMLRAIGIMAWAVRTGGGGGHLYLRSGDGEVANLPLSKARALGLGEVEVRGNGCYVLAPPSVHPDTGTFYEWLSRDGDGPPVVSPGALDWFPLMPRRAVRNPGQNMPSAGYAETALIEEVERVARTPEGGRNDQLNRSAFALGQLVAVGALDYDAVFDALYQAGLDAGLGKGETARTLSSGLDAGRANPRHTVPGAARADASDALHAWLNAQTWHERKSASRRAVALALAERARTARHGVWRASVRELAALARLGTKTTQNALSWLQEVGYVTRAGQDKTSGATLWRAGAATEATDNNRNIASATAASCAGRNAAFAASVLDAQSTQSDELDTLYRLESNSVSVSSLLDGHTDAIERGALGKNGYLVYRALLSDKPRRAQELANTLGLTLRQVRYALGVLKKASEQCGVALIEPVGRGWLANPVSDEWLDKLVAAERGTLGKGEARRARFERERQKQAAATLMDAIAREKAMVHTSAPFSRRLNRAA